MEPARQLFERFTAGGFPFLQQVVAEEWAEHALLDFKTAEKHAAPMTGGDQRIFAKALSGFNWSEGGVIVWGIDCRQHGHGDPDTAKELRPIANLKRFETDLQRFTAELVSPGIEGAEHFLVEEPTDLANGYAVTYVPKSQGLPSMARAKDQFRYYYRSGSVFRRAEPSMIADRFSRRPQPVLELDWHLVRGDREADKCQVPVVLGVRNTGAGVALYPAITVAGLRYSRYGIDGNMNTGLPMRPRTRRSPPGSATTFAGGVNDAIHPGTTLDVTCMTLEAPLDGPVADSAKFQYELHCDGFSVSGEVEVPAADIERARDEGLH